MELRLGLIGAGNWGRNYISTLKSMSGIRLSRLASSNLNILPVIDSDCILVRDWRDVAHAKDIHGVIISTPPKYHIEMAKLCIDNGLPVLIEKPLAMDLQEAEEFVKFVRDCNGFVLVDHIHLYSHAWRMLKQYSESLGDIRHVEAVAGNWGPFRKDTPVIWDWGAHDISMCIDLMGRCPEQITATVKESMITKDGYGEILHLQLEYKNDVLADISIGNIMPKKHRWFSVSFENDVLVYNDVSEKKLTRYSRVENITENYEDGQVIDCETAPPLMNILRTFAEGIKLGKSAESSDLELALDVVRTLCRADSILKGQH